MPLIPMTIAVDIGNTQVKVGLFAQGRLQRSWQTPLDRLDRSLSEALASLTDPPRVGWVSVARPDFALEKLSVWERWGGTAPIVQIDSRSAFPLENRYATPHTLGTDRIVGVVGARRRCPRQPVLVIDAGTALTYDLATAEGVYLGGGIAPGLRLRFRALHEFTARLPEVALNEEPPALVGDSTAGSIQAGVLHGMCAEIDGMVQRYRAAFGPELQVFLTGGDLYRFENQLQCINFADSNLVLKGIHHLVSDPNFE